MEPNKGNEQQFPSRKIRNRNYGRKRAQPYSRRTQSDSAYVSPEKHEGFLQKLTNYLVPSWFSNAFQSKEEDDDVLDENSNDASVETEFNSLPELANEFHPTAGGSQIESKIVAQDLVLIADKISPVRRTFPSISNEALSIFDKPSPRQLRLPKFGGLSSTVSSSYSTENSSAGTSSSQSVSTQSLMENRSYFCPSIASDSTYQQKLFVEGMVKEDSFNIPQSFSAGIDRPSFKISSFISPNVSMMNDTTSSAASPFYKGRTSFGGASSSRAQPLKRQKLSPVQPVRLQVEPKALQRSQRGVVTSATAKRILSSLEQLPSPLKDAKKLPVFSNDTNRNAISGRTGLGLSNSPYPRRTEVAVPPNKGLSLLQKNSMSSKRDVSFLSNKDSTVISSFTPMPLPALLSVSGKESMGEKSSRKMKRERSKTHISRKPIQEVEVIDDDEEDESVNMMATATPLVMSSLPKFGAFKIPDNHQKKTESSSTLASNCFTFSTPTVMQQTLTSNTAKSKPSSTFCFSTPKPFTLSNKNTHSGNKSKLDVNPESSDTITSKPSKPFTHNQNSESEITSTESDTIMFPAIGLNKFKMAASEMTASKDDTICETVKVSRKACPTSSAEFSFSATSDSKPFATESSKSPLFSFASSKPSWECKSCHVKNDGSKEKCVACGTDKNKIIPTLPSPAQAKDVKEKQVFGIKVNDSDKENSLFGQLSSSSSSGTALPLPAGFALAAAKPGWDCDTCMIKNDEKLTTCAACGTNKPGADLTAVSTAVSAPGFSFGLPKKEWECKSCLAKNNDGTDKCSACGLSKATVNPTESLPAISASSTSTPTINPFGTPKPGWDCSTCLIRNDNNTAKCVACDTVKPGSTVNEPTLSFGSTNTSAPTFNFGSTPKDNETSTSEALTKPSVGFSFGNSVTSSKSASSSVSSGLSNTNVGFSFGVTKDVNKTIDNPSSLGSSGFSFGTKPASDLSFGASEPLPSTIATTAAPTTEKISFGTVGFSPFGVPKPGWDCGTCMIRNDEKIEKCVACGTIKPGCTAPAMSSGLNFGTSATGGFSFGIAKPEAPVANIATSEPATSSATSFGTSSGFTFESSNKTSLPEATSAPLPGFTFGSANVKPTAATSVPSNAGFNFSAAVPSTFTFGTTTDDWTCKKCSKKNGKNVASCLSCGQPKSDVTAPAFTGFSAEPKVSFGSGTGDFAFKSSIPAAPATALSSTQGFNFGAPTPATASFGTNLFNASATVTAPAAANLSPFTFGSNPTPAPSTKPFTFGAATNTTFPSSNSLPTTSSNNLFNSSLGNAPGSTLMGSQQPSFAFGSTAPQTDNMFKPPALNASPFPPAQPTPNQGFNFGSSNAPSFNFTANANPQSIPGTSALPTFNSTPEQASSSLPRRKFKRAIRRTQR